MGSTLLQRPSLDFKPRSIAKTPFERNLLPRFARWFVTQFEDQPDPDFFIPVETKGARLLDAVIAYARDELASPLRVPVLYRPALAYLDPAAAAGKTVVILDDATRSGGTLARHREAVRAWGEPDVLSLACVADAGARRDRETRGSPAVRCWLEVPSGQYHDVLWQLAQLVVAHGLPPEVDHHVFRIGVRSRLSRAWQQIAEVLEDHGRLTHDGPLTQHGDIFSMTLHWPTLPGQADYPTSGPVRDEGVRKLRLFADFAADTIHVVPMVFPALDLPSGDKAGDLELETCLDMAHHWTGGRLTVAQMLIELAQRRSAETLHRALGTGAEVDMVAGLAELLGRHARGQVKSFTAQRDVFARLYGPRVGRRLADRVDGMLVASLDQPGIPASPSIDASRAISATVDETDSDPGEEARERIKDTTTAIVSVLKSGYKSEVRRHRTRVGVRYGLSLTELTRAGIDADRLTLSRAIDHGLAVTSLVPYTDVTKTADGVQVRRKYRASEQTRQDDAGGIEDLESHNRQTDEEAVALVLRTLRRRSDRWHDSPIAGHHLSKVIAVLEGLVLDNEQITLGTRPSEFGPYLALASSSDPDELRQVVSEHFQPVSGGFIESDLFQERYEGRELRIQQRGAAGQIESYLRDMIPVLDGATDISAFLMCWSTSAAGKLGLDFVRHDLELALRELDAPLRVLKRGSPIDPARLGTSVERARRLAGTARSKVTLLSTDWSEPIRASFPDPMTVEGDLLRSAAAPSDCGQLMQVAEALCLATRRLAELVGQLEAFVPQARIDEPVDPDTAAIQIVASTRELVTRLTSMRDPGSMPHLPADPARRRRALAEHLERALLLVRARAAAFAWSFLGVPQFGVRLPETRRRTILFSDMSGSTPRGLVLDQQAHVKWKNSGLNLIAQWGQSFGGTEVKDREGDDVVMEFADADAAVLCAALIQEHTRVLRSTGLQRLHWAFRIALDSGEVTNADGGNVIANAVNRAAKLAKSDKDDPLSTEWVRMTPETADALCRQAREHTAELPDELDLAVDDDLAIDVAKARFHPLKVDTQGLIAGHIGRLRAD
jgi:hypothetical protein